MAGLVSATGLAPRCPPQDCLTRDLAPMVRASGFDSEAVAPGIQQVAQQHLSFVTLLRTNQFADSQLVSAGHIGGESPLEGRIHLDNYSLRIASGHGEGSVFESGAESRSGVLSCCQLRPRKWGCGVHTDTVARDDSRKERHDGLIDTLVLPKRESPPWQIAPFRSHYRGTNLTLRRAYVTQIRKCLWKTGKEIWFLLHRGNNKHQTPFENGQNECNSANLFGDGARRLTIGHRVRSVKRDRSREPER
jgi:hypothetical protein